uniref:hypothetical protein n=1 Tax=Nocardioides stalactiti TaxID=2755356 RepID=UPI001600CA5A
GVAGAAAAVIVLTGSDTVDVKVPATADIYLVGADDELTAQLSDPGTEPIKIDVDGASTIRFTSVEGDVAACDGCAPGSPDGSNEVFASTAVTGFNGIPGVTHADRALFVVGVFVGEDQPAFPSDAVEDLTEESDAASQSPYLGEPIFIGDGETDDGTLQEIEVPSDATALYIGFADGYGFVGAPGAYGDNSGTVSVEVEID